MHNHLSLTSLIPVFSPSHFLHPQIPLGAGIAFAHRFRKDPHVCVAMYGDGAANQVGMHFALRSIQANQLSDAARSVSHWNTQGVWLACLVWVCGLGHA